jgi:uncharacterized membrane protein (DUF373 family)
MDHRFLEIMHQAILVCIRVLAVLMVAVIFAGTFDVLHTVYNDILMNPPYGFIHVENIVHILGAFLAVLIAIEIYTNIIIYLKEDSINLKLVLSTALIAIARKVIVLDYKTTSPEYIYATAAVILAAAGAYWIVTHKKVS